MKITSFHPASYTVGFAVDDREISITLPHDAFSYDEIAVRAYREYGVAMPFMSQSKWGEALQAFIRDAIANGQEIAPLSAVNRIVTGCEEPRKH